VYTSNVGSSWQVSWLRLQGLSAGAVLGYLGVVITSGLPWALTIVLAALGMLSSYIRANKQYSAAASTGLTSALIVAVST
jgi:F0F1-type ATP synthase assembly protein I